MRRLLFSLLRILVSLGLLAFLLTKVGMRETWETLRGTDLRYFLAALAIYLVSMVLKSYRWQILLRAQRVETPLPKLVSLYLIGTFFNQVLPTGFGGDAVRIYEFAHYSKRLAISITTVVVDRFTGLLVLFAMASLALVFSYQLVAPEVRAVIVFVFLGSLFVTWVFSQRVIWQRLTRLPLLSSLAQRGKVRELYESAQAYTLGPFARALAVSLALNILIMVTNYLAALSLGMQISFIYLLLFIPIISFLLVLPISFSGLGIREGGYVYLFTQVGVPSSLALALSLCIYSMILVTGLIGGLLYAVEGYKSMRSEKGSEDG